MRKNTLTMLVVLTSGLGSAGEVLAYEECGTPLPPSYKGITAFANGEDTNSGESCTSRGAYGLRYQCVEYVKRFYAEALNVDVSDWRADAYYFYDKASEFGLDRFANNGTTAPEPDDIIVFKGGEWGHVAIAREVTRNGVTVIEQNFGVDSVGLLSMSVTNGRYNVSRVGSLQVIGWLRLPSEGPPPVDYDEARDGDIEVGEVSFSLGVGRNTISGNIGVDERGPDGDTFEFTVPAGREITSVRYRYSNVQASPQTTSLEFLFRFIFSDFSARCTFSGIDLLSGPTSYRYSDCSPESNPPIPSLEMPLEPGPGYRTSQVITSRGGFSGNWDYTLTIIVE